MSSTLDMLNSMPRQALLSVSRDENSQRLWKEALGNPLKDFLGRTGKRIRAELIEIAYQLAGGSGKPPRQLAEFVELLHAGSLIIDDIQDNSRNRRQQESMHLKYGVPIAINTGNWLYFAALDVLTDLQLPPSDLMRITKRTLQVIKRCHEGQALDLTATFDGVSPSTIPEIVEEISQLKTGGVTALAAWLGGVVAGANEETCQSLSDLGKCLGVGLQMQNDFVELQKAASSRCNSDDLRNRRCTWPWAWLAEAYPAQEIERLARLAVEQMPESQECAGQILERIEIVAVNEINEKLVGSIVQVEELDAEDHVKAKLNKIVKTLELHYV